MGGGRVWCGCCMEVGIWGRGAFVEGWCGGIFGRRFGMGVA